MQEPKHESRSPMKKLYALERHIYSIFNRQKPHQTTHYFRRYAMVTMAVISPLLALLMFYLLFLTHDILFLAISLLFTINTTLFSYHHFLSRLGITKKIAVIVMHVISPALTVAAAYGYVATGDWLFLLIPVAFALMPIVIFFVGLS